jgi:gliding motility associated protien GldN
MRSNIFKLIPVLFAVVGISLGAAAQDVESKVLDGPYHKHVEKEKKIIPYEHIREADASWRLRIWRVIDVREKMNLAFKYPRLPLIEIIHEKAKNGELTVYDPTVEDADEFVMVLPAEEAASIGAGSDTIEVIDPVTFEPKMEVTNKELQYVNITKFRLKEDWVFDKETSTMMVRIIGVAPLLEEYDESGNYRGDIVMYWIYWPDLRTVLVNYETFNPMNDAVKMTWEDIFEMRMFSSYVIKESNIYDRRVQEYATGLQGYLEGESIKKKIFKMEHQLWRY